jgi:uncharacterized protein (TIGR02284 family)
VNVALKYDLSEEIVSTLQDLIQINLDSANGFEEAAEKLPQQNFKVLFSEFASERRANAAALQQVVEFNDERPREEGSFLAAMHRAWLNVRAALNNNDAGIILKEAERGEESIRRAYENAVDSSAESPIHETLVEQQRVVVSGFNRLRALHEQIS